jgi:PIN domain nuclease of toxin-antitoxin system
VGGRALILADTQALLWLDFHDERLGPETTRVATTAWGRRELAVATITFWEVATLLRKGRLRLMQEAQAYRTELTSLGLIELDLGGEAAALAGAIDDLHGDPADRIIVATAVLADLPLLTADERILAWRGPLDRIDACR